MPTTAARSRVYNLLETADTFAGRILNLLLFVLIVVNVVAVILESVAAIYDAYRGWFDLIEIVSVVLFSFEYLGRVWVSVESDRFADGWRGRLRYMLTPMALVDLVAIAPFYLGFMIDADTRILRALRLLRLFKLARHSAALDLMLTVMRKEAVTVASSLFVMLIIIVLSASGMYLIEREAQPEAFQSIPHAMWWAAVTLSTVGYGDVVPVTIVGKVFGLIITLAGVGMVALPAGILASGFSQELQQRRAQYQLRIKESLADGQVTDGELQELQEEAENLGLSDAEAAVLLTSRTGAKSAYCPHCGKALR